jgi:hypothetical protein
MPVHAKTAAHWQQEDGEIEHQQWQHPRLRWAMARGAGWQAAL